MRRHTGTVLRKELLDIIRDRRSIITALVIPLLLYPMMFGIMGSVLNSINKETTTNTTVMIEGSEDIAAFVMQNVFAGVEGISRVEADNAADALENGDVKVVLRFPQNAMSLLSQGARVDVTLIYNESKSASSASLNYVQSCISSYNEAAAEQKLSAMNISLTELKPFAPSVITVDELTGKKSNNAGMMLSMLLPMLVTIYLSIGGMSVATDMFAGEKERHTMEALLCTRAGRNDILIGKFAAVVIYSLVSVATSVAGIVIAYAAFPEMMSMGEADMLGSMSGFSIPLPSALFTVAAIAVLAMTFAALQVIISCWSRTVKEAGTYVSFIMLASYVPIFATMMMQAGDFKLWSAFVPVLNTIGCMKMVLGGISDYLYMGVTLAISAVFLLAALTGTRLMFRNENIMLRG